MIFTAFTNSMASTFLMSDNEAGAVPGKTSMNNIEMKRTIFSLQKLPNKKHYGYTPKFYRSVPPHLNSDSNYYARPIDNNGTSILSNYAPIGGTNVLTLDVSTVAKL